MYDESPSLFTFKVRKRGLAVKNRRALCAAAFLLLLASGAPAQTTDRDTKFRLAQGLEQAGEYERASALYEDLLRGDSTNVVLLDAVERMMMQLKQYDRAVALLERRIRRSERDPALRATLGSVLYRAGREKEATAAWDAAIAADSTNPGTYRLLASVLAENRLLDRAAEIYRRGRAATGDPGLFTLELAQLLASTMNYAGATTEYLRWLGKNPTQISFVQSRLAQITGREEAREAVAGVIRRELGDRQDLPLLELLAWLAMEGKKFEDAFAVERKIDALAGAHGGELLQFAEHAAAEKAYGVASRAFQEALNAPLPAPRIPYARYGYACAVMESQAEVDTFSSPVRGTPATEAIPLYGGAVRLFQEIIERYPRTEFAARSWYQVGVLQSQKFGDREGAAASFRHAAEEAGALSSLRNQATLMLAKTFVSRGDTAGAALCFHRVEDAPDAHPDEHDEAVFRRAEIDYFAGRFDSAGARLAEITLNLKADYANDALRLQAFLRENAGSAPEALRQFARAEFLARQGKNTEAVPLLLAVVRDFPRAPLADDALMMVGTLQAQAGLFRDAAASYERLLAEFREGSVELDRARFNLAEVYQYGLHDGARAQEAYERLLADHPKSLLAGRARQRIRQLRGETP